MPPLALKTGEKKPRPLPEFGFRMGRDIALELFFERKKHGHLAVAGGLLDQPDGYHQDQAVLRHEYGIIYDEEYKNYAKTRK